MTRERGSRAEGTGRPVRQQGKAEIKSFTGLRGLAVLFVMLFHWFPQAVKGGYLGVVIFMVLSGYLVTSSFLAERAETGELRVFSFYGRRLKRLYPPLIAFILLLNFYLFVSKGPLADHFGEQAVSTLLGYNNWYQIGQKLSYFDQGGNFNALTHMWTLSVEQQIYLVWPLILSLLSTFSRRARRAKRDKLGRDKTEAAGRTAGRQTAGFRSRVFLCAGLLTLASYISLIICHFSNPTSTRAYYGTDTRLFAFTLGAGLAALISRSGLRKLGARLPAAALNKVGVPLLILVFAFFFTVSGQGNFAYAFGMFAFAVATVCLLAVSGGRGGFAAAFFRLKPLQFLGRRSYSLYLWQYGLMIVCRDLFKYSKISYGLSVLLQIPFLLILTELSYRFLEMGQGQLLRRFFRAAPPPRQRRDRRTYFLQRGLGLLPPALLVVFFVLSLLRQPLTSDRLALQEKLGTTEEVGVSCSIGIKDDYQAIIDQVNRTDGLDRLQKNDGSDTESLFKDAQQAYPELALSNEELDSLANRDLVAVGDSVTLATEPYLKKLMPKLRVHADVSRQFPDGMDLLKAELEAAPGKPDILYFLGTNGVLEADQIDRLATAYPDRRIFLMTIVRPESDVENRVNTLLKEGADRHPNISLLDWYHFAKTKGDLFFNDGVHPNQTGGAIYACFVAKGVAAGN